MFCSDQMSSSHFIMQTSKFLLIDATAVTLGQDHGKVIQYISPDLYIPCQMVLMREAKVVAAEINLKQSPETGVTLWVKSYLLMAQQHKKPGHQ